jgi:hypothetical protein
MTEHMSGDVEQDIYGKYQPFLQGLDQQIKAITKTYQEYQQGFLTTPKFWRNGGLYQVISTLKGNPEALEYVFEFGFEQKDLIDKVWVQLPGFMLLSDKRKEEEEARIRELISEFFELPVRKIIEKTHSVQSRNKSSGTEIGVVRLKNAEPSTVEEVTSVEFDMTQRYYELTGVCYDLSKSVDHCILVRDNPPLLETLAIIQLNEIEKFKRMYSDLIETVKKDIPENIWERTIAATADKNLFTQVKILVTCAEDIKKGITPSDVNRILITLKHAMNNIQHNVFWEILWSLTINRKKK